MSVQPPLHQASAAELKARLAEERRGEPFVVYRDGAGGQRILSLGGRSALVIGRSPAADLALPWDTEVSRVHAELRAVGGRWLVGDDGLSRNGTFLNGERVRGGHPLHDGDELRAGRTTIAFCHPAGEGDATRTTTDDDGGAHVTAAQRRVLVALCRPCLEGSSFATPGTNQQIADELYLSVPAVKTHLRALFTAFGIGDLPQNEKRSRLVALALEQGLVGRADAR